MLTTCMSYTTYKRIVVTKENYEKLQNLGKAGQSFNDVITKMLQTKREAN